jgi:hypothetical protein
MAGFLGSGDVLINRKNPTTGLFEGWSEKLYASAFEPRANAERQELLSKSRDGFGQAIGSVSLQRSPTFRMTLRDANKEAITLLFLGDEATFTQAAASVTDELVRAYAGKQIRVAKRSISAVVLTSSPAGTNYVLGTDYEVTNARLGMISVIAGSSLATAVNGAGAAGLPLLVDYSHAAMSGYSIRGATQPSLRAWIMFDGKNQESQEDVECEVYEVVLTPDAGFDFLADGWNEVPLTGTMITPAGKTMPFEVRTIKAS